MILKFVDDFLKLYQKSRENLGNIINAVDLILNENYWMSVNKIDKGNGV